ncbi:hypothetical protein GALMADRAFT_132015 [Galerina marginata CBS 339.88]|uniref:ATP-dependent RNA helicase n=1 Tax=Galerina marginata (strain CBS 339.88) TaxID=685588 RepID=A0A067TQ14_GALM3|nr:hypothetical protein GALMADRAFT_132015 [Galerina marginata CBS 339.88]
MSGMYEAYAQALAKRKPMEAQVPKAEGERLSFPALGLDAKFVRALKTAFPDVQQPTEVQERLIPEVLGKRDILLKDATGTGKSFGLVVGLLNKPRMVVHDEKGGKRRVVTTLFVVPHRDLAYQLFHWVERLTGALRPSPALPSIAQILVRGSGKTKERVVGELRETPPHILICTPQALMEVYREDKEALQLDTVSTVVVDEVDYLVETDGRKVKKHAGPTREILDVIYRKRKELCEKEYMAEEEQYESVAEWRNAREEEEGIPQLIVSSATLRVHFKNHLFEESGWLNSYNLVKISGQKAVQPGKVQHSILVVTETGIRNVEGAVEGPREEAVVRERAEEAAEESLEAIATAFALHVPSIALLVIPSSAPVHRVVHELRGLGVNAEGLDVRAYLADGDAQTVQDGPRLLVGTVATTRGLDMPELSHVFVLGVPEGRAVDGYTHIAGRVGRFGRRGRVVSVVTAAESRRMMRILRALGERPVLFEHFD